MIVDVDVVDEGVVDEGVVDEGVVDVDVVDEGVVDVDAWLLQLSVLQQNKPEITPFVVVPVVVQF